VYYSKFSNGQKHGFHVGRLWWCPSGTFTYLPLHAAAPVEKNTFIQSYIPNLGALLHANSKYTPPAEDDALVAVGVVTSLTDPEVWKDLPSVEQEVKLVTTLFENHAQQLQDLNASINNVLEAIKSSSWIHLACHGEQDLNNPLESGLILYDGKLELSKILDIDLPKAKFVYLSACETAMGDGKLVNEAMHLAGGFLTAGFQGAIGTSWNMSDRDGPIVAKMVYQRILGERNIPDVKMAAEGLHLAVQALRKSRKVPPSRWMPFVHFGI
jgi:CHAT domain-containing protein